MKSVIRIKIYLDHVDCAELPIPSENMFIIMAVLGINHYFNKYNISTGVIIYINTILFIIRLYQIFI